MFTFREQVYKLNAQNIMTAPARTFEIDLLKRALQALANTTGLVGKITDQEPLVGPNRRPDATIEIEAQGHRFEYLVEIKRTIDRVVLLANVKAQLREAGDQGLLITDHMTPVMANRCRTELDLQFVDTNGNAYLRQPGLYVFVKGEQPADGPAQLGARGGGTAAALRVVFTLICNQQLLNAPYREIVAAAGVALGTVGWVFFDLEGRGLTIGNKGQRRLVNLNQLINEWTATFPLKLRPKLNRQRFRAENIDWWKNVKLRGVPAWWGGEIAANKLTNYLNPTTFTIYVDPHYRAELLRDLVAKHRVRLRADPKGDIEILDRFWNLPETPHNPDCTPPLLVYADLMATLQPRNIETAALVRDKLLHDAPR